MGMNNATRNDSTNETTPMHIWKHEVLCAAIAKHSGHRLAVVIGETAREVAEEIVPAGCPRMTLWYRSGESVCDAADMLAGWAYDRAIATSADREIAGLKNMLKRAAIGGSR